MALNPQTLYGLYDKGIIEYVPTELLMPSPIGAMTPMVNPYLNLAKQGGLYQSHGNQTDSFSHGAQYTANYQNPYSQVSAIENSVSAGAKSNNSIKTMFNGIGIGEKSHSVGSMFGIGNTGYKKTHSTNAFGEGNGVGAQSSMNIESSFGGFQDVKNGINEGVNTTSAFYNGIPNIVKGIAAGIIGTIAIVSLFKRGKKPPVKTQSSIWQKINPMNWFKKK